MGGVRRLYLDDAPGELRGVVALNGMPERLLIERASNRPEHRPGARLVARVRRIESALASAFLDVGAEPDAVLPTAGLKGLSEGARILVEVIGAPRLDKGAVVRLIGKGAGTPRLAAPAPDFVKQLQAFAPGVSIGRGRPARGAADAAEAAVLAVEHALPGAGRISIEQTRALTAIDVDLGSGGGSPSAQARRAAVRTNLAALETGARLLRLKGLGGLIVFDLVGKGHDGDKLTEAALAAFAPDQPGVAIGRVSRFGLLELALPRRGAPLAERLVDQTGRPTPETTALRLLRDMEAQVAPGAYIEGRCAPDAHEFATRLAPLLAARIGPRFRLSADASLHAHQTVPLDRLEFADGHRS